MLDSKSSELSIKWFSVEAKLGGQISPWDIVLPHTLPSFHLKPFELCRLLRLGAGSFSCLMLSAYVGGFTWAVCF